MGCIVESMIYAYFRKNQRVERCASLCLPTGIITEGVALYDPPVRVLRERATAVFPGSCKVIGSKSELVIGVIPGKRDWLARESAISLHCCFKRDSKGESSRLCVNLNGATHQTRRRFHSVSGREA